MITHPPRIRSLARVFCVSALSLALASAAAAQTSSSPTPTQGGTPVTEGHWTVTPFIGFGFSGDLDSATGAFGAAAGYTWSDRVRFEGELNVLPSSENNGAIEVGSHVWSLTGNLLYRLNARSVVPYGAVGIGFAHAGIDTNDLPINQNLVETSSTNFVLNFGGGLERRFAEHMLLRGDLRYFFGGDLVPDYWRVSAGVTVDLGRRP